MPPSKHLIEHHPLGATVAANIVAEFALRQACVQHHPLRLAVAIQFWDGDKAKALTLSHLLTDLEAHFRDDVMLVFAARFDVPMDAEIWKAMLYAGRRFHVAFMQSKREQVGHPDGCHGLWAGTLENVHRSWLKGWPCENVFFVEADGVPTRFDWIDSIKTAHAANLLAGRRITGARMEGSRWSYSTHVNGSMIVHASALASHPEWLSCPSGEAWDCFHAQSMLAELGEVRPILNLYGAHDVSLSVFKTIGHHYAWLASVKDGSAWKCALSLVGNKWARLAKTCGKSFPRRRKTA